MEQTCRRRLPNALVNSLTGGVVVMPPAVGPTHVLGLWSPIHLISLAVAAAVRTDFHGVENVCRGPLAFATGRVEGAQWARQAG